MTEETEEEEEVQPKAWSSSAGLKTLMSFWEGRGAGGRGAAPKMKYASESHLADGGGGGVPENGLRRQVKERDFTSGEEEEWEGSTEGEEGWEEHIYARIEERNPLPEESGFFSHEETRGEEDRRREDEEEEDSDEFFIVAGMGADPRHVHTLSVVMGEEEEEEREEERHVTRIEVDSWQPREEERERQEEQIWRREQEVVQMMRLAEEEEERQWRRRRDEEEQRRKYQKHYEEEQRQRDAEQRRKYLREKEAIRSFEEAEEEATFCPRQSVRDLRALYERVGRSH